MIANVYIIYIYISYSLSSFIPRPAPPRTYNYYHYFPYRITGWKWQTAERDRFPKRRRPETHLRPDKGLLLAVSAPLPQGGILSGGYRRRHRRVVPRPHIILCTCCNFLSVPVVCYFSILLLLPLFYTRLFIITAFFYFSSISPPQLAGERLFKIKTLSTRDTIVPRWLARYAI